MDKFAVSGSELVWHDNMSTFHWGVALTQFYINDEPVYSAREEPHEAILDSGNSYFNLPGAVYDDIYSKILNNTSCTQDEYTNLICKCPGYEPHKWDRIFPRLATSFDGTRYEIPAQSYIMPQSNEECIVELHKMDEEYWNIYIFGLTFMENYYSVYDMENNRVGLALSNHNKI
jgi:hypothetical protein